VDGTKSLGDAFRDMAGQIISDLLRISIQRAIIAPLAATLFPSAGAAAGVGGIPGFATGGSMVLGGFGGVDKNLLSMNGIPIARVSRGETMNISPGDSGGGMSAPFIFNNYAAMSDAQARRTGMQAAAGWRSEMAKSAQKGF
jgi:hypothetical protein